MNWKYKNAVFHLLRFMPAREQLYYLIQKNITKSVYVNEDAFANNFAGKVEDHMALIYERTGKTMEGSVIFEFGAGWDLMAPIGFCLWGGVKRYIAVDLNKYIRPELIKRTLKLYLDNMEGLNSIHKNYLKSDVSNNNLEQIYSNFPEGTEDEVRRYLDERLRIEYYAPFDAGNTGLKPQSVDYVISNVSLEHIPEEDIPGMFPLVKIKWSYVCYC